MRREFQGLLIALYRRTLATGILSTRLGKAAFEFAYLTYKALVEAGKVDLLHAHIVEGGIVIDVGANIGFFTLKFARWVGAAGHVFAIEPEQENFDRLSHRVNRQGFSSRVSMIRAVAAEKSGELKLAVNPTNPADHRLSDNGIPVRAIMIDDLCASTGWPAVCLIKIDVQGAEDRVVAGALETLKRFSPALYIEIEETSSAEAENGATLIDRLASLGYLAHTLEKDGAKRVTGTDAAMSIVRANGYADFLFLKMKKPQ
ncbi:MAG: FkbM family methyltransferase [Pseudomonadota bacterium]